MKQFALLISLLLLFTVPFTHAQLTFSSKISLGRSSAEVGVGDFDHDGFNDIAVCNSEQRWYKGPTFQDWYQIGNSLGGPYAARVADINNDGWDDFITSDGAREVGDIPGHIYVYLNPGITGDTFGLWERIVVYSGNVRHQNDMRIVDMDGDGRLDIIERTWSSERVVIAFQNEDINNWTVRPFDSGETGKPEGISAGDIDGDGQMEIILSGEYWTNPGGWRDSNYTEHLIDPLFIQEEVKSAVGDIDNDGDMDVYIGSAEKGFVYLAWYENMGIDSSDGSVIFQKHLIKDNFGKCHMVELLDIDKDGDLDLCTGRSFGELGCLIFYNENNGSSWTESNYDSSGTLYTGIVADLDADGDLDVVGPSGFYSNVYYYLNETPGEPPGNPKSFSASLLGDGLTIQLMWEDTTDNEGSFEIERFGAGSWTPLTVVPANNILYADGQTQPDSSYQYRLRAANAAGVSEWVMSGNVATWQQAAQVNIWPISGNYLNTPIITLTASAPYDEIRYTLDGSQPDENAALYYDSFSLNSSGQVKTISIGDSLIPSPISCASYNVAVNGNFLPEADAGKDTFVFQFTNILLNGNGSEDLDDSLTYQWNQISGPTVTVQRADSVVANFTPTIADAYEFELTVMDEIATAKDTVRVTVSDLDQNLVAYWPMNEVAGPTAKDVKNNYDGSLNGGHSWQPNGGKLDGALFCNGTTGRTEVNSFDVGGGEITISLWVKPADLDNVEARFVSKANGSNGTNHHWMLSANGGSALRFRLKTSSGGTTTLISSTGQIEVDEWTFVTATYDGAEMKIYNDTTLVKFVAKTGSLVEGDSIPIAIGNQPTDAGDRPFSGLLDDVRIYNKALTLQEIKDLYNGGCSSYITSENLTIDENTTLIAKNEIQLKNVTVNAPYVLTLRAPLVSMAENCVVQDGAFIDVIYQTGCQ